MPIVDVFSSRNAKPPEVWIYDRIPDILRVQVSNIARKALGTTNEYSSRNAVEEYKFIASSVAHEHGLTSLVSITDSPAGNVLGCIRTTPHVALWCDCVEITFRVIEVTRAKWGSHERQMADAEISAADAISELNERFRRAGFGYRYEDRKLYRIDSELMHQEATIPALRLLSDPRFAPRTIILKLVRTRIVPLTRSMRSKAR